MIYQTVAKHRALSADLALIGRLGCSQRVEKLPSGQYSPQIGYEMHPFWVCSSPVCDPNELGADFLAKLTPSARCGERGAGSETPAERDRYRYSSGPSAAAISEALIACTRLLGRRYRRAGLRPVRSGLPATCHLPLRSRVLRTPSTTFSSMATSSSASAVETTS